jgi:uncharacterized protein YoxC
MSPTLEVYLNIFLTVTAVLLIIISVFLIKLLLELSKLTNNMSDITTVVKNELAPTVQELRITLKNFNSLLKATDDNVEKIKGIATKLVGASSLAFTGLHSLTGSFWKGITTGFKLFSKRK